MMVRENDRFDQRELSVRRKRDGLQQSATDARDVQRSARGEQRAGHAAFGEQRAGHAAFN